MSITGINNLIEETGTPRSLVYVGGECLLSFPTNQQAWQYLVELSTTADDEEESWPEDIHVAFMIEEVGGMILVPEIDKVVKEGEKLTSKRLWGQGFDAFRQRIINDWPSIKEGLSDA